MVVLVCSAHGDGTLPTELDESVVQLRFRSVAFLICSLFRKLSGSVYTLATILISFKSQYGKGGWYLCSAQEENCWFLSAREAPIVLRQGPWPDDVSGATERIQSRIERPLPSHLPIYWQRSAKASMLRSVLADCLPEDSQCILQETFLHISISIDVGSERFLAKSHLAFMRNSPSPSSFFMHLPFTPRHLAIFGGFILTVRAAPYVLEKVFGQ